jgi:hypothetical protein
MKTNATINELKQALNVINNRFDNNIRFKTLEAVNSKKNTFTLTVNDSRKAGGRISNQGRRIAAACWHVHGYFFEALLKINPNIYIISGGTMRIDKNGGNWQDRNIGSNFMPLMYSEACECNPVGR